MNQVIINKYNMLCCPKCGENYLHQKKVEIFNRDEDEKDGLHLCVVGKNAVMDNNPDNMKDNPSSRRQGITIDFYCELCSDNDDYENEVSHEPILFTLAIYQHKGVTMMEWLNK